MIFDKEHHYSDAQVITASARSTNNIDHGVARYLNMGENLEVLIWLDAAADNADGDETYTAKLRTADNPAFTSATDLTGAVTIPPGSAVGSKFFLIVSPGTLVKQYTEVYYALGGVTPSLTASASLVPSSMVNNDANIHFRSGVTIAS